jgi:hypothetical protein
VRPRRQQVGPGNEWSSAGRNQNRGPRWRLTPDPPAVSPCPPVLLERFAHAPRGQPNLVSACAPIFSVYHVTVVLHVYFKETKIFKTDPHKEIRLRGERAGILFQAHAGLLVL